MKKLIVLTSILLFTSGIFFTGCESNDQTVINTDPVPSDTVYNKKILVEFFTNTGCNPCLAVHNYFDEITELLGITINDTNVIIVSFHTQYPRPDDPFYVANIPHSSARTSYYGINFTPQCRLNGVTMGTFSASDWTILMNSELRKENKMNILLSNNYDTTNRNGSVTADINLLSSLPTNDNVVHVVITESNIHLNANNGVTNFNDVMRNMLTGSNGEAITLSIGANTPVTKTYNIPASWNQNECYATVFIQSTSTKEVYGVERIKVRL